MVLDVQDHPLNYVRVGNQGQAPGDVGLANPSPSLPFTPLPDPSHTRVASLCGKKNFYVKFTTGK